MNEELEESYFQWLYSQVGSTRERVKARSYWDLLRLLYRKEFVWFVPNDDNRIADANDLRLEFFANQHEHDIDEDWIEIGCSMLELLITVSRTCAFESGGSAKAWFWKLLENLEIDACNDASGFEPNAVDEILDRVIFRTYDFHGVGGLFPLRNSEQDQREVELWYQLNAYLIERF